MSEDFSRGGIVARPRRVAFYLPQYHPIPENDLWWGPGFTDWVNVARARPLFRGHLQPDLPGELGFYDLRLKETRVAQAALARAGGIDAFCYYHYWFRGRRLLNRPFDEVLASGEPDLPFCLCWANESWTRSWDGRSGEVLIEQTYGEEDDEAHIEWLLPVFRDRRYVRVEGRPLFLVYRASDMPDPLRTTALWRRKARGAGIGELHLCRVESFEKELAAPPQSLGFDAAVEFQPDWTTLRDEKWKDPIGAFRPLSRRRLRRRNFRAFDYGQVARLMSSKTNPPYLRYPCVAAGWDNSPRHQQDGILFLNRDPDAYREWLSRASARALSISSDPLVFINAWNEWAEGNHLEPCRRFGRRFLEATRDCL